MKPLTLEEQMQMLLDINQLKSENEELKQAQEKMAISYDQNFEKIKTVVMKQDDEIKLLRSQVNALNGDFA